ncbi:MAG: hypothetical protein WCA46_16770 [Actinocatenispora sp.]
MLFALAQPLSALGLVLAFLVGLVLRATGQDLLARRLTGSLRRGPLRPVPRRDVDPFGALAMLFGGTGWGRAAPTPTAVFMTGSAVARRVAVYLAGPVIPVLAGECVLAAYSVLYPRSLGPTLYLPSDVLSGIPGPGGEQLMLSLGVGLLCFGIFAVLPLPPCDGWGLLWLFWRRPGERARRVRYWLDDRNVGVVILLVLMLPLGVRGPLGHSVFNALGDPLVRPW